jgi:hypothetical protein
MRRTLYAIATLLVVGCGGLALSNSGDADTDGSASHVDAATDGGNHSHDAGTDSRIRDAATDVPMCPGADAASPWSVSPSGTTSDLYGVWGSGPNDVWAVGSGVALHWEGTSWSVSVLPTMDAGGALTLSGVWGSAANDVWAVGSATGFPPEFAPPFPPGVIVHWTGVAWSSLPLPPAPGLSLSGVWGTGANDVWSVGGGNGFFTAVHWDGTAWSAANFLGKGGVDSSNALLRGIWGSGPNDVWAGGWSFSGAGGLDWDYSAFFHWDGTAWSVSNAPTDAYPVSASTTISSIWGLGSNEVWVGGGRGSGAREELGFVDRWNGMGWSSSLSPSSSIAPPGGVNGLWGSGPNDMWAVGGGGTIVHWNGSAWSTSSSGTADTLVALWGTGPCDVWAVGAGGTILHHP